MDFGASAIDVDFREGEAPAEPMTADQGEFETPFSTTGDYHSHETICWSSSVVLNSHAIFVPASSVAVI